SPDGRSFLSAGSDHTVRFFSGRSRFGAAAVGPQTGQAPLFLRGNERPVWAVAFSPDGQTLASVAGIWADEPGEVKLWDAVSRKGRADFKERLGVRALAFAPDGQTLATSGYDGVIRLRDTATGKETRGLGGHRNKGVSTLAFSPDGKFLASGGLDN